MRTRELAPYFATLERNRVLSPERELVLAEQIETADLAAWRYVLDHHHTAALVVAVIRRHLAPAPDSIDALERTIDDAALDVRTATIERASADLRAADPDRVCFAACLRELERSPGVDRAHVAAVRAADGTATRLRAQLAAANLRLVVKLARSYAGRTHLPFADLVQEGNVGLLNAVGRFDRTRGVRFATYASLWIRHSIRTTVNDISRPVRVPQHVVTTAHRILAAQHDLVDELGRPPTDVETASHLGVSVSKMHDVRFTVGSVSLSINQPADGDDGDDLESRLTVAEDDGDAAELVARQQLTDRVAALMGELQPIELDILRHRFGLGGADELTLAEIGATHALSRERIRQLQIRALDKLRRGLATDTAAAIH